MSEAMTGLFRFALYFLAESCVGRLDLKPPLEFMQNLRRDEDIPPYVGFVFYLKDINGVRGKAPS